jgi:predicted RNA-binding protein with TRAM domain
MNEQAPVKEGEAHDVLIKAVGEKGDGIARVNGFVLFVGGVKKGDYVKIKITKVLEKVGFAQLVEKLEKPERQSKFATVSQEEMAEPEPEIDDSYEDTDDFGEDLDDDE